MLNRENRMISVSVIIPLCIAERSIESCLLQTKQDLEIILITNESTDLSAQTVNELVQKSKQVRNISIEGKGLSEAKNMAISAARGKYIYFLNQDGMIDSKCLETCCFYAENNALDMIHFGTLDELEQNAVHSLHGCNKKIGYEIRTGNEYVREFINECSEAKLFNVLIRKSFLIKNEILFMDQMYYTDVKFYFDCMIKAKRVMFLPFQFYHYIICVKEKGFAEEDIRKIENAFYISMQILNEIRNCRGMEAKVWLKYGRILIHNILVLAFAQINCINVRWFQGFGNEIVKLLKNLVKEYLLVARTIDFSLDICDSALELVHIVLLKLGYCPNGAKTLFSEIDRYRNEVIIEKIQKLPLSDSTKRIGVYGAGKHSDFILSFYRENIGDITGNIIWLDSKQESGVMQKDGFDIVNIKDINSLNLDYIIVLSYLYETEMVLSVKASLKGKIPIYTLYNGDSYPLDIRKYKARILEKELKELPVIPDKTKRIVLLNLPDHTNIGDYMITLSEENFIKKYFPDWEILEFSESEYEHHREEIGYHVRSTDIVCITGGGFLGDLWPTGANVNTILEDFKANKIIVFPQSIYFKKGAEDEIKELCRRLSECTDVTVCFREEISYHRAKDIMLDGIKMRLLPDFVLGLEISLPEKKRQGILLCLRNDIESILSGTDKYAVWNKAKEISSDIALTSMHWGENIRNDEKQSVILKKLEELKNAELVITDTLHCMISCVITGTPCVAINNLTDKIKGVYKWVEILPYIVFFEDANGFINFDLANWIGMEHDWKYQSVFAEYEQDFERIISS